MAINPRDVPITRDQVSGWIADWKRASNLPKFNLSLEDYLAKQIAALALPDTDVDTVAHDNLKEATPILEMILMDLPSYMPQDAA